MNTRAVSKRRARSVLPKLVLVGFGLLLSCVLLEVGLRAAQSLNVRREHARMFGRRTPYKGQWATYDPQIGYIPGGDTADYNTDGLRDHPIRPKNGRFRLLFLGDSISVYGESVDDTLVGRLRAKLHELPAYRDVDVINGAVIGYTNYQELLFLKRTQPRFQPDLVAVQFCLNDLHKFQHAFEIENGRVVAARYKYVSELTPRSVQRSWPRRLARRSLLLTTLRDSLLVTSEAVEGQAPGGFSFDRNSMICKAWQDPPWQTIERQLGEMVDFGRQQHFRVFLVAFPMPVQYDPNYLAQNRDYVLKPQRMLKAICAQQGIDYLDLYSSLEGGSFYDGIHLTDHGRQKAGQVIAEFLVQSGLLPAERAASIARVGDKE